MGLEESGDIKKIASKSIFLSKIRSLFPESALLLNSKPNFACFFNYAQLPKDDQMERTWYHRVMKWIIATINTNPYLDFQTEHQETDQRSQDSFPHFSKGAFNEKGFHGVETVLPHRRQVQTNPHSIGATKHAKLLTILT